MHFEYDALMKRVNQVAGGAQTLFVDDILR